VQSLRHRESPSTEPTAPRQPRHGGMRTRMEDRLRRRFDEN